MVRAGKQATIEKVKVGAVEEVGYEAQSQELLAELRESTKTFTGWANGEIQRLKTIRDTSANVVEKNFAELWIRLLNDEKAIVNAPVESFHNMLIMGDKIILGVSAGLRADLKQRARKIVRHETNRMIKELLEQIKNTSEDKTKKNVHLWT